MTKKSPKSRKTSEKTAASTKGSQQRSSRQSKKGGATKAATGKTSEAVLEATAADAGGGGSTDPAPGQDFSPDELRAISEDIAESFPLGIEQTQLVLMDVEPDRVHAYWNLAYEDAEAARKSLGTAGQQAPLVLRFHDRTPAGGGTRHGPLDVVVQGLQGHQPVDLWTNARHYAAELGLRGADGALVPLARSNEVETPSAQPAPAPNTPYREMSVKTKDTRKQPKASPSTKSSRRKKPDTPRSSGDEKPSAVSPEAASADVDAALRPGTESMAPQFPEVGAGEKPSPTALQVPTIPAVGADQEPVRPRSDEPPSTVADTGARTSMEETRPPMASAVRDAPPPPTAESAGTDQWTAPFDAALQPPDAELAPVFPQAAGAESSPAVQSTAEIAQEPPRVGIESVSTGADQPWREETQGAPLTTPVRLGPSFRPGGAGSSASVSLMERVVTYSSGSLGRRTAELEINAELHVHGRARPGTELTMFGRPVALRPDGSFSVRRALPEGAVVIPLVLGGGGPPAAESEGS